MAVTVDQISEPMRSIESDLERPLDAPAQASLPALGWTQWLSRPLSGRWCAFGWMMATAVFVGVTQLLGGPTQADANESFYSTWAIAHGQLSCSYPVRVSGGLPFRAPLYPLVSGVLAALGRIGNSVPFPSLGRNCASAVVAMEKWGVQSGADSSSVRLGYFCWLVLAVGVVALLRASGRGRCGWEPAALVLLAIMPPVCMCLQEYFHPEDLLAMGLALGGLACARRGSWAWAGILLGLSFTSQPFALLIIAPMLIVAPPSRRIRFAGSAVLSAMAVIGPMILLTSGQVIAAVTGGGATPEAGASLLAQFHFHGLALLVLSRILPIALSMALAQSMVRRLGPAVLESLPLTSLIAVSLTLRLVFEVNLYGYYLMAIGVMLIALEMMRGRISVYLVGWIALVFLAFDPLKWGDIPFSSVSPILWQLLVVPTALLLAAAPLISTAYPKFGAARRRIGPVLRMHVNAEANTPAGNVGSSRLPL
jgi:hypothetical protein